MGQGSSMPFAPRSLSLAPLVPVRLRGAIRSWMTHYEHPSQEGEGPMPIVEYPAGAPFPGVIGCTVDESSPAWPALTRAPKGTPNVRLVCWTTRGAAISDR